MFPIYQIKEKDDRSKRTHIKSKNTARQGIKDRLYGKEQTLGITGLGNCVSHMKRKPRTNLACCKYHAVSLSIEK